MSLPTDSVPGAPETAEIVALREIAGRLEAARDRPGDMEGLLQAVRLNWRLWTIIQVSLLEADCPLPLPIRNNVLSLSNFVDRHSAEIIAAPDVAKLGVLIRLNRDLAAGLSGGASQAP
jgi:flagellar protein FlaF